MTCHRFAPDGRLAGFWHRLRCAECRHARPVDLLIDDDLRAMRTLTAPGLSNTLDALGLSPLHPEPSTLGYRVRRSVWNYAHKRRRVVVGNAVVVVLAFALFRYIHVANELPEINIPRAVVPSPNGFDAFLTAGNALKDEKAILDAYRQKDGPLPSVLAEGSHGPPSVNPEQGPSAVPDADELVAANAAALELLRTGLSYGYEPPMLTSVRSEMPYLTKYRLLAQLLALEARVEEERGDYTGAMNSRLDAIEFGEIVAKGPLISALTGVAYQSIGRRGAWKLIPHLSAQQARAAAQRLADAEKRHVPLADTLQTEKWWTEAALMELFRHPEQWEDLYGSVGANGAGTERPPWIERKAVRLALTFIHKRNTLESHARYMDAIIATAHLPYNTASRVNPPEPADIINRFILPVYGGVWFQEAQSTAANRLLRAALLLHAFQKEHEGRYPDSFSYLVPRYCGPMDMQDPFSTRGGLLKYRRNGPRYVLYSVGPDGRDDGGRPAENAARRSNPDMRYQVQPDAKGDIVSGLNVK